MANTGLLLLGPRLHDLKSRASIIACGKPVEKNGKRFMAFTDPDGNPLRLYEVVRGGKRTTANEMEGIAENDWARAKDELECIYRNYDAGHKTYLSGFRKRIPAYTEFYVLKGEWRKERREIMSELEKIAAKT